MKKTYLYSLGFLAAGAFLFSCAKENANLKYEADSLNIPDTAPNYKVSVAPSGLNTFSTANKKLPLIDDDKAMLGRVLFYDKKLSLNNTVSCGSCHHQSNAFADKGAASEGFNGGKTSRNSMAICNTAFTKGFFWDKRTLNIEDLVLQPVRNHIEMGIESTESLVKKLGKADYYGTLFERAYGSKEVTREKVVEAMTSFLNSMVAANSKFDQGAKQNFINFTPLEAKGKQIFQKECGSCHSGSNFNSNSWDDGNAEAANIGLDKDYTDPGMGAFVDKSLLANDPFFFGGTGNTLANGVFKVPSLRNVELTGPYMHDGRFNTLEEVIEHYNSGIQEHPALDWRLQDVNFNNNGNNGPRRFNWTGEEKASLIAFLKTLTDQGMISDAKFANPFLK